MVSKFSDWLLDCGLKHELITVKGGWIISFTNPPNDFTKLIQSVVIPIPDDNGGVVMVKSFTTTGDIVFEKRYVSETLNTLYGIIRDYCANRDRQHLG